MVQEKVEKPSVGKKKTRTTMKNSESCAIEFFTKYSD